MRAQIFIRFFPHSFLLVVLVVLIDKGIKSEFPFSNIFFSALAVGRMHGKRALAPDEHYRKIFTGNGDDKCFIFGKITKYFANAFAFFTMVAAGGWLNGCFWPFPLARASGWSSGGRCSVGLDIQLGKAQQSVSRARLSVTPHKLLGKVLVAEH